MNSREGMDMVKMSISVLLLTLLIGAIMGMFYFASDSGYREQKHLEDAAESGKADNLFDLTQYTRDVSLVPVPTAVSAITEFEDEDVLFVRVCVLDSTGNVELDEFYAPRDSSYTFDVVSGEDAGSTHIKFNDNHIRFVNTACRRLLQYSDDECQVIADKLSATDNTGVEVNAEDQGMLGVSIIIHRK